MTTYRYAKAVEWAARNDVLLDLEVGIETDTSKRKVGDGTTPWNSLTYSDGLSPVTVQDTFNIKTVIVTDTSYTQQPSTGVYNILADCSVNNVEINLPSASISSVIYNIKKIDGTNNSVTINPYASETVDDETTISISSKYHCLTLISNGYDWYIV